MFSLNKWAHTAHFKNSIEPSLPLMAKMLYKIPWGQIGCFSKASCLKLFLNNFSPDNEGYYQNIANFIFKYFPKGFSYIKVYLTLGILIKTYDH